MAKACPACTSGCTGTTVVRYEDLDFLNIALTCNDCDETAIYEFCSRVDKKAPGVKEKA